jgi:hypothetical protein
LSSDRKTTFCHETIHRDPLTLHNTNISTCKPATNLGKRAERRHRSTVGPGPCPVKLQQRTIHQRVQHLSVFVFRFVSAACWRLRLFAVRRKQKVYNRMRSMVFIRVLLVLGLGTGLASAGEFLPPVLVAVGCFLALFHIAVSIKPGFLPGYPRYKPASISQTTAVVQIRVWKLSHRF